jgi:hypothetical protein
MLAFVDWLRASAVSSSSHNTSSTDTPSASAAASGTTTAISLRDLLTWAGFVRAMTTPREKEEGEGGDGQGTK